MVKQYDQINRQYHSVVIACLFGLNECSYVECSCCTKSIGNFNRCTVIVCPNECISVDDIFTSFSQAQNKIIYYQMDHIAST